MTTAPKAGRPAPYEEEFDEAAGRFANRCRDPQGTTLAALRQVKADSRTLMVSAIRAVTGSIPVRFIIAAWLPRRAG